MADSSETRLYYIKEVTPGVTPAVAPKELRFSGETLSANTETAPNPEIRPGRQVQDEIRTRIEPQGDISIVPSALSHDDLFEGFMTSAWGASFNSGALTTIEVLVSGGNHDIHATSGTPFTNVAVNDWVYCAGFANAANNGFHKVLAKPDNATLRVGTGGATATSGSTLVAVGAGASVTIRRQRLANGTTKNYFTLEKRLADLSPEVWFGFQGCLMGGYGLAIEPNRILEASLRNIIGKTPTRGAVTLGSGAPTVVSTNKVMDSINAVQRVRLGGINTPLQFQRLSLEIDNGLRGKPAVGVRGNADVALSDFSVTGQLVAYYDSADASTLYDNWVNDLATKLSFSLLDASNQGWVFDLPTVKIQTIRVVAGAKGQDMVLDMNFRALEDPTEAITLTITKNY
jgi:hypothetical protein